MPQPKSISDHDGNFAGNMTILLEKAMETAHVNTTDPIVGSTTVEPTYRIRCTPSPEQNRELRKMYIAILVKNGKFCETGARSPFLRLLVHKHSHRNTRPLILIAETQ